jgi:hypothetical protein
MLDECTKQALINNFNECLGTVSLLLSGISLSNWKNVVKELPAGHIWAKETFDHTMTSCVLKYCSDTARQEQKWFM